MGKKQLKKKKQKEKLSLDKIQKKRGSECEQYPAFSFRYLTKKKKFNFDFFRGRQEEGNKMFRSLSNKMKELSEKSYTYWNGIGKEQGGIETISFWQCKLKPYDLTLPPDETIIVIRFCQQKYRLLGVKLDKCPTLHIIGFDFDYSAYNHGS